MLINLSGCGQNQIDNQEKNRESISKTKPRVLENISNKPLVSSLNIKKTYETVKNSSKENSEASSRVTKVFGSGEGSTDEEQFSNRFIASKDLVEESNNDESLIEKQTKESLSKISPSSDEKFEKPELQSISKATNDKIKVGLLLPLSGSNSIIGKAMLNAATMAMFDLSDSSFELLPRDTKGSAQGSVLAINDLISNGAEIILGPIFSESVKAISPIAQSANISVIAFSNDSSISGKNIFSLGFSPEQQIERIVSYANSQGVVNYAAVVPRSAYGEKIIKAIESYIPKYGGRLTKLEFYDTKQGDYREVIKKITDYEKRKILLAENKEKLLIQGDPVALKALERLEQKETMGKVDFDAIIIPEGGARLRSIVPLLAFYDVDPRSLKILGTGLWDEPGIGLEPALVGGWFAGPSPKVGENFRSNYKEIYGAEPPRLASLSYDATALAIVLSRNSESSLIDLSILTNSSGFTGVDGLFRFNKEGLAERGLAILEINKKGFKIIDSPPENFNVLN